MAVPNPTGKGGFKDNPQNRANGKWKAENSQRYCLNMFLNMTEDEFTQWEKEHPVGTRTMAQVIAYRLVTKAKKLLPDYREVVDRTEGKAKQSIDLTTDGESLNTFSDDQISRIAERITRGGVSSRDTASEKVPY